MLALGLSARGGAVFGDPGGFFISQKFSLGGVQYGEPLRGYQEFSITPHGLRSRRRRRRTAHGAVVRQRVLHEHGGARPALQSAALSRRVLRRGQHLGAAAGLQSDAPVPRRRLRWRDRHAARTARPRLGVRTRPRRRTACRTRSGSCTSSSDSSSNHLEFSCVLFFRAAPVALALLAALRRLPCARAGRLKLGVRPDQSVLLDQAPGPRRGRGAVREGDGDLPRPDQAHERLAQRA